MIIKAEKIVCKIKNKELIQDINETHNLDDIIFIIIDKLKQN